MSDSCRTNRWALQTLGRRYTAPTSLPQRGVWSACLQSQQSESSEHAATLSHFLSQQQQESAWSLMQRKATQTTGIRDQACVSGAVNHIASQ